MPDPSKTLMMGTDVATLLLFDPADLAHTEGWPLGWYAMPEVWQAESAAGRLVAWSTGSDGGFKVRLTTGGLSVRETAYARQSWVFPYAVHSGRVLIDNSDCLLGESRMTDPEAEPDLWFALEPGDYHVTVSAIEWQAEPGADAEGFDSLPNFVVAFAPRGTGPAPAIARRPPDILPEAGSVARDTLYGGSPGRLHDTLKGIDLSRAFPAAVCAGVMPAGEAFTSTGEASFDRLSADSKDRFALFDVPIVVVPEIASGALGQVCNIKGIAAAGDDAVPTYTLRPLGPVTIASVAGPWGEVPKSKGVFGLLGGERTPTPGDGSGLWRITVKAATLPDAAVDDGQLEAYRAQIIDALAPDRPLAMRVGGAASYHRLLLATAEREADLSTFLLLHLPLAAKERLALSVLAPPERLRELSARLQRL